MTKYDTDHSGSVDLEEFTHYMTVGAIYLPSLFYAPGQLIACTSVPCPSSVFALRFRPEK